MKPMSAAGVIGAQWGIVHAAGVEVPTEFLSRCGFVFGNAWPAEIRGAGHQERHGTETE